MARKKDGEVEMVVGVESGKVILRFDRSTSFVAMDPQNCLDVTEALAGAAFEARDDVRPVGPALKAELVERHRQTLNTRIALVLNSSRENKTLANGKLAQQLVDIVLAEIF